MASARKNDRERVQNRGMRATGGEVQRGGGEGAARTVERHDLVPEFLVLRLRRLAKRRRRLLPLRARFATARGALRRGAVGVDLEALGGAATAMRREVEGGERSVRKGGEGLPARIAGRSSGAALNEACIY